MLDVGNWWSCLNFLYSAVCALGNMRDSSEVLKICGVDE